MKATKNIILAALSALSFVLLPISPLLASSQPYLSGHGVNFGVGNKYHAETDISMSGPAPLIFKRTYNSQSTETGILGYGWTSSLTEYLVNENETELLILVKPGGRHVYFIYNSELNIWTSENNKPLHITKGADGYQLIEPNGNKHIFDLNGNIVEKRDQNNNSLFFTYSGGFLTSVSDTFGRALTLFYDANNRLATLLTPFGSFTYTYEATGNLKTVTKPDTTTQTYLYEDLIDVHNLTGIIDEEGVRNLTLQYDNLDRVISSAFADGKEQMTIEYLPDFQRRITNSLGVVSTYQLEMTNGVIRVTSYTGPACSTCGTDTGSSYVYDDRQLITQITDANSIVTAFTYDAEGNRSSKREAVGSVDERLTTMTYIPGTNYIETSAKSSVANPGQEDVTTMSYDANGNLTSRTETGYDSTTLISRTTTYSYDIFGRIETINGPRTDVSDVTSFTYYPNTADQNYDRANLHTVVNALGHTVTYSNYNVFGKPELIDPPYGEDVVLVYDAMGRLNSKANGTILTSYDYYADGKLHIIHLPDSRNITYTYTLSSKPETIIDTLGNKITYTYSPYETSGKPIKVEIHDPSNLLQHFVEYSYEDTGDLDKTIQADGSFENLDYDAAGNLVFKVNALNKTTEYRYDALNRLTDLIEPVNATETATTIYGYDSNDNLKTVTDAESKQTTYTYDDFGRKRSRISPDTGLTLYEYDPADNLISSTNSSNIATTYEYDALNRLRGVHYPDSVQDILYIYDENGYISLLTSVQDSTGTTSYSYDSNNRLTGESRVLDDLQFQIAYAYNNNSQLTSITYPSSRVVYYHYDLVGQISSVTSTFQEMATTIADNITHKPFGPRVDITMGNGVTVKNGYNQLYQLENTKDSAGTIYDRTYQYYSTGNIQAITDSIEPTASQSFTYDDLGRLATAQGRYGNYDWTYDNVGNRQIQALNINDVTTYDYEQNTNRLAQTTNDQTVVNYGYDNVGNMTSMGDATLNWNQNNRLLSSVGSASPISEFDYDSRGLRTSRTVNGETVYSVYDQSGNLVTEIDNQGVILRDFVYLEGQLLAHSQFNEHIYYYMNDHLGTPQIVLDDTAQISWQGDYHPFGRVDIVVNTLDNTFRFPGQYFDEETGLYYNWHRFYDPSTGRYISADPIGLDGGINLYAYVGGDPVNWIDPWGLDAQSDFIEGVGSYFEGLGSSLDQLDSLLGNQGDCEQLKAVLEALAASAVEQGILTDSEVRGWATEQFVDSAQKKPGKVAGNIATRVAISYTLGGTPYGVAGATGLHIISTHGSISSLIREKIDKLCPCD